MAQAKKEVVELKDSAVGVQVKPGGECWRCKSQLCIHWQKCQRCGADFVMTVTLKREALNSPALQDGGEDDT